MTVTERERRRMELVDGSAHRTDLCEQLAMREYELDNLKKENDKLVEQVASLTGRSFRTADKMDCLNAENTKLREYAKLIHGHIKECCDACGERGICDVDALTRSLGIEVSE